MVATLASLGIYAAIKPYRFFEAKYRSKESRSITEVTGRRPR
jgi:hypothetical protein